jgi:hypothetical protein
MKDDIFQDIGTLGLKVSGGRVLEEFLESVRGRRAAATYEEMSKNSSTVGALLFVVESMARQAEWNIEPAGDSPEQLKEAEFVRQVLFEDMEITWSDLLTEILSMFVHGWSYHEIVYKVRKGPDQKNKKFNSKYSDGRIGWRKIETRAQQTLEKWEISPEGDILGMWQIDPYNRASGQVFIPIEKSLLFRTKRTRNNPEGVSILRTALRDYFYLKRIQEIEAIGIERELNGLPFATMPIEYFKAEPGSAQATVMNNMKEMMGSIRTDERGYIIFPPHYNAENMPTGWDFKLLTSGGSRAIDTNVTKNYYKQSIFQSALAQFLQLGLDGGGSHAQMTENVAVFSKALSAQLSSISSVFNRQAIPTLMRINGVDPKNWPTLNHGKVERTSLAELGTFIAKLIATQAIVPDDNLEAYLRTRADLPPKDEETARDFGGGSSYKPGSEAERPNEKDFDGPKARNDSDLGDRQSQRVRESVSDRSGAGRLDE